MAFSFWRFKISRGSLPFNVLERGIFYSVINNRTLTAEQNRWYDLYNSTDVCYFLLAFFLSQVFSFILSFTRAKKCFLFERFHRTSGFLRLHTNIHTWALLHAIHRLKNKIVENCHKGNFEGFVQTNLRRTLKRYLDEENHISGIFSVWVIDFVKCFKFLYIV